MTYKDIYNEFISRVNSEYQDLIEEVESIANKRKNDCNNAYHLSCIVRENLSDNYHNFISNYGLSYGVNELLGTEYYVDSGTLPTKLTYKLLNYPLKYSESLFQ